MYDRWYTTTLRKKFAQPYVHLIFGARQTGKYTLIESLLRESDAVRIDFTRSEERSRFLVDPDKLVRSGGVDLYLLRLSALDLTYQQVRA